MRYLLLLTILPLLLAPDGWKDAFEERWDTGDPAQQRRAVEALARVSDPEVVDVLARTATKIDREIDAIEKRQEKVQAAMRKIPADALLDANGRLINREGYEARKALDAQAHQLEQQIIAQEKIFYELADVFAALTDPAAVEAACTEARRHRSWRFRFHAVRGLRSRTGGPIRSFLEELVNDKEGRVAVEAIRGLENHPESLPTLLAALEKREWQVVLAAALAIEAIDSPAAVGPLIDTLEQADGRLRHELNIVLVALTGENKNGNPELWRSWWEASQASFAESRPAKKERHEKARVARSSNEGMTTFYGINVPSKRLVFVLDRSGSMAARARWQPDRRPVTGVEGGVELAGDRLIDVCRYELKKVLVQLPEDAKFGIIFYNRDLRRFPDGGGLARASASNVKKAMEFVDAVEPLGATNIFDSLEEALGEKWRDQVDTVFLLSDGLPNAGRFTDPDAICSEIRRRNLQSRVKINTVFVGTDRARELAERLAKENGGHFVDRSE